MTIEVGYRYVSSKIVVGYWDGTGSTLPTITATPTVQDGVAITLTGVRFSSSGNRVFVGSTEVSIHTESTTSIVTDAFSAERESMVRQVEVYVVNASSVESNHLSLRIQPATGQAVFAVSQAFLGDPSTRLEAEPDLVVNDEIIILGVTGTNVTVSDVIVDGNGTTDVRSDSDSDPNVSTFQYRVFDGDRRSSTTATVSWDISIAQTITPDVLSFTQAAAEASALSVSMTASVVAQVYSSQYAIGTVAAQFPAPGASVNIGSVLEITLSLGPAPILAPNLDGFTPDQAAAECLEAGVVLGVIRRYVDGDNSGLIVNQSVVPGTEVASGTVIDVAISSNLMPDVVGQLYESGLALLNAANLVVDDVNTATAVSNLPFGYIVSQSIEADEVVAPLALIVLTVSSGKPRVRVQVTESAGSRRRRNIF